MLPSSSGWRTAKKWFDQRKILYLGSIAFISIFMGTLIFFTWNGPNKVNLVLCIVSIPITLLLCLGAVLLFIRWVYTTPILKTTHPVQKVLKLVGWVLDQNDIPWTVHPIQEYPIQEAKNLEAMTAQRLASEGLEAYFITVPTGKFIVRSLRDGTVLLTVQPKDTFTNKVMMDIHQALS